MTAALKWRGSRVESAKDGFVLASGFEGGFEDGGPNSVRPCQGFPDLVPGWQSCENAGLGDLGVRKTGSSSTDAGRPSKIKTRGCCGARKKGDLGTSLVCVCACAQQKEREGR